MAISNTQERSHVSDVSSDLVVKYRVSEHKLYCNTMSEMHITGRMHRSSLLKTIQNYKIM